jgi:hypothetical protein
MHSLLWPQFKLSHGDSCLGSFPAISQTSYSLVRGLRLRRRTGRPAAADDLPRVPGVNSDTAPRYCSRSQRLWIPFRFLLPSDRRPSAQAAIIWTPLRSSCSRGQVQDFQSSTWGEPCHLRFAMMRRLYHRGHANR